MIFPYSYLATYSKAYFAALDSSSSPTNKKIAGKSSENTDYAIS